MNEAVDEEADKNVEFSNATLKTKQWRYVTLFSDVLRVDVMVNT